MLTQGAHPLAGAGMTGAEMLVQVLADEGVDTVFGYSGGAILPIYDAVFRYNLEHSASMPLIVPANEQGAGFMAAGYARASGRVGVALVTSGPGATNTVTPVRDCQADSVPIVVICGQVATTRHRYGRLSGGAGAEHHGRGGQARVPGHRPDKAGGDGPYRLRDRPHRPPGAGRARYPERRAELEGRISGVRPPADSRLSPAHESAGGGRLPEAACAAFFAALGEAKRPLIYAGGGVVNAGAARHCASCRGNFGFRS